MINSLIVSALCCTATAVAHYYHITKASVSGLKFWLNTSRDAKTILLGLWTTKAPAIRIRTTMCLYMRHFNQLLIAVTPSKKRFVIDKNDDSNTTGKHINGVSNKILHLGLISWYPETLLMKHTKKGSLSRSRSSQHLLCDQSFEPKNKRKTYVINTEESLAEMNSLFCNTMLMLCCFVVFLTNLQRLSALQAHCRFCADKMKC